MVTEMSEEESIVASPSGTGDPDTLDLGGRGMEKLARATPELILNTTTLLLDKNKLTRLDNIHTYQCLEKLSASHNQLIRMFQVAKLHHLKVLDLSSNSLVSIEGLKDINLLTWLSLADNNIKTIENLSQNVHLEHLDLSGNSIATLTDLALLKNLKTLMLHSNKITSLRSPGSSLPPSLTTLTLSSNQLGELADTSCLAKLSRLDQLTLADNPCIAQPDQIEKQYDHRPYVINWCLGLRLLDGVAVGAKESLKAEWMYSQSKGRQFGSGEQASLVEYLVATCPLDPDQETDQDRKLNLILSKVQEHQSSLRRSHDPMSQSMKLPRGSSAETRGKTSAPTTPRRAAEAPSRIPTPGHCSTPTSALSTPTHTPSLTRRHSTGRGSRLGRSRSSPTPQKKDPVIPPVQYKMELPPTLYGDDLVNGNTQMMTQSMDPAVLADRLDNGIPEDVMSVSSVDLMSQSVDVNMLRDNLNERGGQGTPSHTARPRTLFYSNRGSTDSGIRSDDQLEVQDISDCESSSLLPSFSSMHSSRLQSRLNPVPESLNSPDIAPGPSPPRRDDPMISGPLHSIPTSIESRLNAARSIQLAAQASQSQSTEPSNSPRTEGLKKSDVMVAAVTARICSTPKTPTHAVVARPTSAVKPTNISSKVDSGLSRAGLGRTPVTRTQRSHSAGPTNRKNSLPNRQVAALKSSTASPSPDTARKRGGQLPHNLADDEASDTEPEAGARPGGRREQGGRGQPGGRGQEGRGEVQQRPRARKEAGGSAGRGRRQEAGRRCPEVMSKSSSSVHLAPGAVRPRSTSLTRSQSARLGGRGGGAAGAKAGGAARPRSSTHTGGATPSHARGPEVQERAQSARTVQAGWRGHQARTRDPEVREVQEELRNMRLEAHTKQLSKELRSARAALEQERKLRKVQSDTIKVLWKEIQSLQLENEMEYDSYDGGHGGRRPNPRDPRYTGEKQSRGYGQDMQRATLSKNMRVTERKLSRLLQGAQCEDSDSSRGDDIGGEMLGSGSSNSSQDRGHHDVADLTRTCSNLQSQVEALQANLASVIHFVSERSRHSSSSQDTPPLRSAHPMTTSLQYCPPPPGLPSSMTMSLPPSLLLPAPPSSSRSCDSLAQTDIVAVRTPQGERHPFLNPRGPLASLDTSDSDCTKLGTSPPSPRARSPRPSSLPVGDTSASATPKRALPRGSQVPGMAPPPASPPGPPALRHFAKGLAEGLLSTAISSRCTVDTADEVTDISLSTSVRPSSRSSQRTVESDSLEDSPKAGISSSSSLDQEDLPTPTRNTANEGEKTA